MRVKALSVVRGRTNYLTRWRMASRMAIGAAVLRPFERGHERLIMLYFQTWHLLPFCFIPWLLSCGHVTIDEELALLEDSFRRLKIEYDIYFAGAPRSPRWTPSRGSRA